MHLLETDHIHIRGPRVKSQFIFSKYKSDSFNTYKQEANFQPTVLKGFCGSVLCLTLVVGFCQQIPLLN